MTLLALLALSSCGGSPRDSKTAPVGQSKSHAVGEFREYALLYSKGDFQSPVRVFASRRPGGAVDRIIEIDTVGNGRYANVQLDCKKQAIAFTPDRIVLQGRLLGRSAAGQSLQGDSQTLVMSACHLDWKDPVGTRDSDLRSALSSYAPRKGTPPPRPQIPSGQTQRDPK